MFNQVLEANGMGQYSMLILMVVMLVMMYFTAYLPQKKRKKEMEEKKRSLKVGDEVVTVGGIRGVVVERKKSTFIILTAKESKIEFLNDALSFIVTNEVFDEEVEEKKESEVEEAKRDETEINK